MPLIFASSLLLGFSGAMMPGPLLTYTLDKSLNTGPRAGFVIITGHALLEITLIGLIFLGFDIILQSGPAQVLIGIVGGLLLVTMGADMIRRSLTNRIRIEVSGTGAGTRSMMLSGALITAANPYFLLWWAVIGLGFLVQSYRLFGFAGVLVFYAGHVLADIIWYGAISVVVGNTRRFIRERLYRGIIVALGGVLIFFGCTFFYNALQLLMV